jgi:hypothetical protein
MMIEKKTCPNCNKEFERTAANKNNWQLKKFCSGDCRNEYNYQIRKPKRTEKNKFLHEKKNCVWCGNEFVPAARTNYCCSSKCQQKYRYNLMSKDEYTEHRTRTCAYCGHEFVISKEGQRFCSQKCATKWHDSNNGPRIRNRLKERANGYGLSLETHQEFVSKCSICGWKYNVNVHHILPKSKGGKNTPDNYMALCYNCHRLLHYTKDLNKVKLAVAEWRELQNEQ